MFGAKNKNENPFIPFGRKRKSSVSQKKEEVLRRRLTPKAHNLSSKFINAFTSSKIKNKIKKDNYTKGKKPIKTVKVKNPKRYVERSQLREEINDLENSLISLTKKLAENRKNQSKTQISEQSKNLNFDKVRNHSGKPDNKLSSSEESLNSGKSSLKDEIEQSAKNIPGKKTRARGTNNAKGSFNLIKNTKPRDLSSFLHKPVKKERNSQNLRKIDERLERVKTFLNDLHITAGVSSLRKDGITNKDGSPKKSNSTDPTGSQTSSDVLPTKEEGILRNTPQRRIRRNSFYRNRVLVARAPLLETIIEEPEKEEEEAKKYENENNIYQ